MGPRFLTAAPRSSSHMRFIGLGLCLSFILFFFWPHPPASLLLLVLAAVLAYIRLEIAIALLPLTFPYYEFLQPLTASGYPAFSLGELGLFICLGVAALRHILRPDERQATKEWLGHLWQQARPFIPPIVLFLLGASLGLLVTPILHVSLRSYREMVIEPLLYFLLILRYLRTYTDLVRALGALILSALVVACLGIGQGILHLTSFGEILNATRLRIAGPTDGANNLAFLVERAIPLLLALALLGLLRRRADRAAQKPISRDTLRWVCLVLAVPLLWALYWSDSRGAEFAILVVVFFFFACEVRSRLVVLVIGGASILGIALFWSKVVAYLNEPGHGAASQRLYIWKAGVLMVRDHFLLGTGLASFNTYYRPDATPVSYLRLALNGQTVGAPNPTLSHPHDFILDFWISTGLLGVIAILWLLGAFATVTVRTYRRCAVLPQGPLLQRLVLGIAGCMLVSVVHGFVDNMYFIPDLSMIFWLFMGVLLVLHSIVEQQVSLRDEAKKPDEQVLAA